MGKLTISMGKSTISMGKSTISMGKSTSSMGKSTISMAIVQFANCNSHSRRGEWGLWSDDPSQNNRRIVLAGKKGFFKWNEKHLHTIHKKLLDWVMISFFMFFPLWPTQTTPVLWEKSPFNKPDPWNVAALGARATDVNLSPFQATSDCANMIASWRKNGDFTYSTTNWLVVYLPLWKIWVKWDDEIPNMMGKLEFKMFQTTNHY